MQGDPGRRGKINLTLRMSLECVFRLDPGMVLDLMAVDFDGLIGVQGSGEKPGGVAARRARGRRPVGEMYELIRLNGQPRFFHGLPGRGVARRLIEVAVLRVIFRVYPTTGKDPHPAKVHFRSPVQHQHLNARFAVFEQHHRGCRDGRRALCLRLVDVSVNVISVLFLSVVAHWRSPLWQRAPSCPLWSDISSGPVGDRACVGCLVAPPAVLGDSSPECARFRHVVIVQGRRARK